ncbi:restriction endonuclease subunit S, partial [Planktomarina temperata]|nr:restriction endonuclease subunit S [Planktomarina temperata]
MRITNLKRNRIKPDLSDQQHVALPKSKTEGLRTSLKIGDILISITADIGIIALVDDELPSPAYINQHIACLRLPSDQVLPKFIAYYLASKEPQLRLVQMTDVGAKTGINLTTVGNLTFPCPPLAEQHAIAEALSDADGVVEGLERLVVKKRRIKQGAMQDLLTAKRRLPGFSGEWDETIIQDVANVDPEALGAGTAHDYKIKYISLEDVSRGSLNGWTEISFSTSPSRARRVLQKGDVLLGTVRPNLQSHCIFEQDGDAWIGSTGFAVLRTRNELCTPRFLYELIMSAVIGRQIEELIAGSN